MMETRLYFAKNDVYQTILYATLTKKDGYLDNVLFISVFC